MNIHNISTKEVALLETMWGMATADDIVSFVKTLPYKDKLTAWSLIGLAQAGGDDVRDLSEATKVIDKVMKL